MSDSAANCRIGGGSGLGVKVGVAVTLIDLEPEEGGVTEGLGRTTKRVADALGVPVVEIVEACVVVLVALRLLVRDAVRVHLTDFVGDGEIEIEEDGVSDTDGVDDTDVQRDVAAEGVHMMALKMATCTAHTSH